MPASTSFVRCFHTSVCRLAPKNPLARRIPTPLLWTAGSGLAQAQRRTSPRPALHPKTPLGSSPAPPPSVFDTMAGPDRRPHWKKAKQARKGGSATQRSGPPTIEDRPLSGVFAIRKPSGPTSSELLDRLKPLLARSSLFKNKDGTPVPLEGKMFRKVNREAHIPPKMGHGGTLDPLADGVLVIGVNGGTKACGNFQSCTKEYTTIGLLGSSTTSYDCMDPILYRAPHTHVSRGSLQSNLSKFTGEIDQSPPLYSAVRIEGKRLFQYARENIPLPKPIPKRRVTVSSLDLTDFWPAGSHPYSPPEKEVPPEEKELVGRVRALADETSPGSTPAPKTSTEVHSGAQPEPEETEAPTAEEEEEKKKKEKENDEKDIPPAAFALEMTVSGGTYVRSIVHELARSVGSAAHVVKLTRVRQADFALPPSPSDGQEEGAAMPGNTIEWSVFERALEQLERGLAEDKQSKESEAQPMEGVAQTKKDEVAAQPEQQQAEGSAVQPQTNAGASEGTAATAQAPAAPDTGLAEWEQQLLRHLIPK